MGNKKLLLYEPCDFRPLQLAERKSLMAAAHLPVSTSSPAGPVSSRWPQYTPRHRRSHFSAHLKGNYIIKYLIINKCFLS